MSTFHYTRAWPAGSNNLDREDMERLGHLACICLERLLGPIFVGIEISISQVNVVLQSSDPRLNGTKTIMICKPSEFRNFIAHGGLEKIGHVQNK